MHVRKNPGSEDLLWARFRDEPGCLSNQLHWQLNAAMFHRGLTNSGRYSPLDCPPGTRCYFGVLKTADDSRPQIYHGFAVLRQATPDSTDRHKIGTRGTLSYLHGRHVCVADAYADRLISDALIYEQREIAKNLGLEYVVDVKRSNTGILHLLRRHGLRPNHTWEDGQQLVVRMSTHHIREDDLA